MSRTRPTPSLLSANQPWLSKRSTLAAPASSARALRRVARRKASNLKGSVTLQPRPPPSVKARKDASKPSSGDSTRPYSIASPVCNANAAWMAGLRLCATGLPSTA